ncbi:Rha family transcriptional regulator [Bilophila sp.]|uniref:Rha family transcriptional regulator n=1 Tax=Bilophila sp. TaxID=1929485 RepID=UPI003077A50D
MNIEIALKIINGKEIPAVTSLQVAEHFGKEHRNVLADIRKILDTDEDGFGALNFQRSSYLSEQNKEMPMYVMSKDGFVLLVMGYTGAEAMRMKKSYIARFNEMEKALQANAPTSLPEALRAYANILEENELIRRQRDEAVRTKAWISDKKTATAMATASVAVRKVNALEDELGRGKRYKSVKAIPWLLTEFIESRGMYSIVGKTLKRMSTDLGYSIEKIATPEYPEGINAYHVDVIAAFRSELAQNPGMLDRYRKGRAA